MQGKQKHQEGGSIFNVMLLFREAFLTTIFTFAIAVVIYLLSAYLLHFNSHAYNSFHQALAQFQYTDLVFSARDSTLTDTRIVIVNSGDAACRGAYREQLAHKLELIQQQEPAIVGLDVIFDDKPAGDSCTSADDYLQSVLAKMPTLVSASIIRYKNPESQNPEIDKIVGSDLRFGLKDREGFSNIPGKPSETVRYFKPRIEFNGKVYESFAVKIASAVNRDIVEKQLPKECIENEVINYRIKKFDIIDASEVYQGSPALGRLKGKIVLVGYLGANVNQFSLRDNYVTPMNRSFGGHTIPDTYGVQIHAQIISMLLNNRGIIELPFIVKWFLSFIICYLHLLLFLYLYRNHHGWFHLVSKTVQLISFIVILVLAIALIAGSARIKLEPATLLLPVVLSVDCIYFFEPLVAIAGKRLGIKTYFDHH